MTDIRSRLTSRLKDGIKAKEEIVTSTVRLIMAAIKDRDIAARSCGNADGINEEEIMALLAAMVAQRKESATAYRNGEREDLAIREEAEIELIKEFLPQQMDDIELEDKISQIITELSADSIKDMGKVMSTLRDRYAGQFDAKDAGRIAKLKLGG